MIIRTPLFLQDLQLQELLPFTDFSSVA